jgi:osmotically-inducible protein OsmY
MPLRPIERRLGEKMIRNNRRAALAAAAAAVALAGTGCAPLLVGGAAVGGAIVATDRRSVGIQVEDEAIERRINGALAEKFPRERANISVNSYNRRVLLTGEVADEQGKLDAQAIAEKSENVAGVLNELHVGALSSLSNRNFDTALSAKVRAALLEAKGVPSATIKVVSGRSVVYLMGRVTQEEGDAAARVASRVSGARRVVKYFDYLSGQEAAGPNLTPPADAQTK